MSVLSVFNQTVTDLLAPRKAEAPVKTDAPEFDRQLKDAGERFNKTEPATDKKPVVRPTGEDASVDKSATPTDSDAQVKTSDNSQGTQSDDAQPADTTETTQNDPSYESSTDAQAEVDPTQTPVDTTAVESDILLLQQTFVQVNETTQAQAQTQTQSQTQTPTQTTEASQPAEVQQAQAVNTQQALNADVVATPEQQAENVSSAVTSGAIQPQQDKAVQVATHDNTTQNEASASSQRLAVVTEARQSDARQPGSGDTPQQGQGTLKSDAPLSQTPTAQAFNTSASATAGGAEATSTGAQTVAVGDSPVTPTSAAPQVAPGAQAQQADNTQLNTARIARGLQNAVQQKGGSVTLRLTPPEMGTVRIQLQMQNGTVNAQFHAETESTRSLLNQQMSQLRTALEQQGLSVERLGVQTLQQSSGSSLQHESQADRDGQPNDGRSRGGSTRQGDGRQDQPAADEQSGFDQELNHAA